MFREAFFPDLKNVEGEVVTVKVTAGMSILIPSMCLHFVYTSEDTIGYSCNFLSGCELQRFSDAYVEEVITSTFFLFLYICNPTCLTGSFVGIYVFNCHMYLKCHVFFNFCISAILHVLQVVSWVSMYLTVTCI